jgi:preprotein translocase subunit SecF
VAGSATAPAQQAGAAGLADDPDLTDDGVLATELRRERALSAAAAAPARPGKGDRRPTGAHAARPRGKSARPSGKRSR